MVKWVLSVTTHDGLSDAKIFAEGEVSPKTPHSNFELLTYVIQIKEIDGHGKKGFDNTQRDRTAIGAEANIYIYDRGLRAVKRFTACPSGGRHTFGL